MDELIKTIILILFILERQQLIKQRQLLSINVPFLIKDKISLNILYFYLTTSATLNVKLIVLSWWDEFINWEKDIFPIPLTLHGNLRRESSAIDLITTGGS